MDFQFRFTIGFMIKNWIEFEYEYVRHLQFE